jgi:hypothetical protein
MINSCTYQSFSVTQSYRETDKLERNTCELAQRSTPPIGAKMIPIAKKSGKTDFGVNIGLFTGNQ